MLPVAISRTEPAYDVTTRGPGSGISLPGQHSPCASFHLSLENQYLSSSTIGDALATAVARKRRPGNYHGVTPRDLRMARTSEHGGVAVAPSQATASRRQLWPAACLLSCSDRIENVQMRVHSKVCFIDDRLLRVGSANLNNRSMGLDTECDLAVEADEPATEHSIAKLRNRLLAEHLGVSPESVAGKNIRQNRLWYAPYKSCAGVVVPWVSSTGRCRQPLTR